MTRISDLVLKLTNRRLDPAEADVRCVGDELVSGRLMGPRCRYASTVEVAYYFRPAPDGGTRAIVPEPSFWDPQTPFLYEAVIETADGRKMSRRHGLRHVRLSGAGLRVNRRPFRIDGVFRDDLTDAAALRAAGIDTLVCPVSTATADLWNQADELGFFLLGQVANDPEAVAVARQLKWHASALGWIFESADALEPEQLQTSPGVEPLLGLLMTAPTATPPWVQFAAGPASLKDGSRPWLVVEEIGSEAIAGTIGTIRR